MRAIQIDNFGGPETMVLRNVPIPSPAKGEVRLQVGFVGMNPLDMMVRAGRIDFIPVKFPFTPGLEHTGVIECVGESVPKEMIGKRVISRTNFGGYADYSIARLDSLIFLDDRISLRTGCVYRGASFTAWHAINKIGHLIEGETCLLHSAAGPVAIMAAQIAKNQGCKVVGLAGGKKKVSYAKNFGMDYVFDYSLSGWANKVKEVTKDKGLDLILDGNGGVNSKYNLDLLSPLGRLIYIGATSGQNPSPIEIGKLIFSNVLVAGMNLTSIEEPPGSTVDMEIIESVVKGSLKVPITEEVSLEDVVQLHRRLENREIMGRAVVSVGGELDF